MDQTTSGKVRKSETWIWTTLWITSFFDAGLLLFLFGLVLVFVIKDTHSLAAVIFSFLSYIIALVLGAYLAVRYVTKKSLIQKTEATKLAFLSIVVPLAVNVIIWVMGSAITVMSALNALISIGAVFFIIRYLISVKGE